MTAKEIAEKSGVKLQRVYYVAKKINKPNNELPTVEEVINYKSQRKVGRPPKCFSKE